MKKQTINLTRLLCQISKNRYRSQRPFYSKNVRFDTTMSRTPKILSSNLGGRVFRFNLTLESRISTFKINFNKMDRLNRKKPVLLGWGVVGNGESQMERSTPTSTTIWSGGAVAEYRIS
jgi:uncharacterized protein YcgL (UPF0745 family)